MISGGQTGADQGGLLAAFDCDVRTGGTAAFGYKTSFGANPLLEVLGLKHAGTYSTRTRQNVCDSDGTVIIAFNPNSSGSVLTKQIAEIEKKPLFIIDLKKIVHNFFNFGNLDDVSEDEIKNIAAASTDVLNFIKSKELGVLNVAGNRESNVRDGFMPMTFFTRWIIGTALSMLDQEKKLIKIQR